MAYSVKSNKTGEVYYLHRKETNSRGGKRTLYFFKREVSNDDGFVALDQLQDGFIPTESPQTGLPLLKRAANR